ncbi:MAG TPA: AraC family transcriptional regulator [Rhodanobacteraceae bacterium]
MILFDQAGTAASSATMFKVPLALQPFVEHFWTLRESLPSNAQRWRIPPDANPYLIFTVSRSASGRSHADCRLVGPATGFFDMPVAGRVFTCGARLRPGVLPMLTRLPASTLTNDALHVDEIFGARGRRLLEQLSGALHIDTQAPRLMASFLLREFRQDGAFRLLPARHVHSVQELAGMLGWSPRTLQTRVADQVGLPPKLWLRIERLHRAIALAMQADRAWCDIALHCGFADQAHMVREFVALLGESPGVWQRRNPFAPPGDSPHDEPGKPRAARPLDSPRA